MMLMLYEDSKLQWHKQASACSLGGPLRGEASCASCLGQEAGGDAGWTRFRAQVQAGAV